MTPTTTQVSDKNPSGLYPCVICKNPAVWQSPTGHWACQTCRDDFPKVAQFRDQARQRAVERQRADATTAAARLEPLSDTADEVTIRCDTATLYAKLVRLEKAGKIRWDQQKRTWVERPVTTRTDSTRPPAYTADELLDRFDRVRRSGERWTARCPAHEDRKPSLSISSGDKGWLIKCWAHCEFRDIVTTAGLEPQRMFYE